MKPLALLTALVAAALALPLSAADDGWITLFDGKTLDGWTQKNGTATYRVEDGTIVGKTNEGSPNSFLCSNKEYGDFELEFEVKVDKALNSGVQIRSQTVGGTNEGRVNGPQVEIEASDNPQPEAGYNAIAASACGSRAARPSSARPICGCWCSSCSRS